MRINKKLILVSILFQLFILTGNVYATTPAISKVVGTVQSGQAITITGSNMVNDNTSSWAYSENFGGYETVPSFPQWGYAGIENGIYMGSYFDSANSCVKDGTTKLLGNYSAHITINASCGTSATSCGQATVTYYGTATPGGTGHDRYFSTYVRFHGNWATVYQKFWTSLGSSGGDAEWYVQPDVGSHNPPQSFLLKHGANTVYNQGSIDFSQDTWHYFEILARDTSPVTYQIWWDGKLAATWTDSAASNPWNNIHWGMDNWAGSTGKMEIWLDRTIEASSRIYPASTIEVGNSPDYATATKKWQAPIYMSDGSVQTKLDLTGLGSGPYYVWVTNNRQERSSSYMLGSSSSSNTPVANFSSTPLSGTPPLTVSFTDTSTNTPTSWSWTFGDGGTSTSQNPTHQYTSAGTYSVSLLVANNAGSNTMTQANYITVSSSITKPVSNFSATPLSGTAPLSVSFTDTSTNTPTSWSWTFGDGGTSTSQNPTHQYASVGTYSVSLSATNSAGSNTKTQTNYVTISAQTVGDLLSESFDSGSFSARGWYDSPSMLVDTSTKHSGTASLKWHWAKGATQPDSGATMRHPITATDKLYVSYWTTHSSSWVGSGEAYHPHMIMFLTDQDTTYSSLAWTHLSLYIEESQQTPRLIIGDGGNVNYTNGTPPNNLVGITENRAVGGCNGDLGASGDSGGTSCYQSGGSWYNGRTFTAAKQYFSNTCPGSYCKTDWHYVEVYVQMNSLSGGVAQADGVMWCKYDGTKIMDYNNVVYRTNQHPTQKWNQIVLCPWIGDGSPVDQTVWIDDISVSSVPNTPGSGDTTPPPSPSGLQIRIIN